MANPIKNILRCKGDTPPRIGFIGFGEAGYHLAKGLRQSGIEHIAAYDIQSTPQIRQRAADTQTTLTASNAGLAAASDIIFSTVTANQPAPPASSAPLPTFIAPSLRQPKLRLPGLKQSLAKIIDASRARFIEVAVMSAIAAHGHKVPMLTGGPAAAEFAALLTPYGMNIKSSRPGRLAAASKMCRSVIVKGIEPCSPNAFSEPPATAPTNASSPR